MKTLAERAMHRSPRGPAAYVRLLFNWLLVALLALDLAGSPLHAHAHDSGFSSGTAVWTSSDHHDESAEAHADHDRGAVFSHSITALRGHVVDLPDAPPDVALSSATPWPASELPSKAVDLRLPWPPDRHRAGASAFRSLPPDGRAPPLHA